MPISHDINISLSTRAGSSRRLTIIVSCKREKFFFKAAQRKSVHATRTNVRRSNFSILLASRELISHTGFVWNLLFNFFYLYNNNVLLSSIIYYLDVRLKTYLCDMICEMYIHICVFSYFTIFPANEKFLKKKILYKNFSETEPSFNFDEFQKTVKISWARSPPPRRRSLFLSVSLSLSLFLSHRLWQMKVRNSNIAPWCDIREVCARGLVRRVNSLRDYLELTFGILSIKLFASESIRATRKRRVWNVSVTSRLLLLLLLSKSGPINRINHLTLV